MSESQYLIRVELHGVEEDSEVYNKFHADMEAEGYERTIIDHGTKYDLTRAGYSRRFNAGIAESVCQNGTAIANKRQPDPAPSVVVVEIKDVRTSGLTRADTENLSVEAMARMRKLAGIVENK